LSFLNPLNLSPLLIFPDVPTPSSVILFILFVINAFLIYVSAKYFGRHLTVFFVFWFWISISLFLLLPHHVYAYYLSLPLFGFMGVMLLGLWELIIRYSPKVITLIIVVFVTAGNATVVKMQYQVGWLPIHGRVAERCLTFLKERYPDLPSGTEVCFLNFADREVDIVRALHYGRAVKLLYKNDCVGTVFSKGEDAISYLPTSATGSKYYGEGLEKEERLVVKIFPPYWSILGFNGGSGQVKDYFGCVDLKSSSWRDLSIAKAEFGSAFIGDFEVEVGFKLISFPRPSRDRVEADVAVEIQGDRYSIGRWNDGNGLDAYWMWGGGVPNVYIPTKDNSGKLRVGRVGSKLYGDYWDGGKWVNIRSAAVRDGSARVSLVAFNSTSRKTVEVQFDNFKVVSGETLFSKYFFETDSIILD